MRASVGHRLTLLPGPVDIPQQVHESDLATGAVTARDEPGPTVAHRAPAHAVRTSQRADPLFTARKTAGMVVEQPPDRSGEWSGGGSGARPRGRDENQPCV